MWTQGDPVPSPVPWAPALGVWSLSHWTTGRPMTGSYKGHLCAFFPYGPQNSLCVIHWAPDLLPPCWFFSVSIWRINIWRTSWNLFLRQWLCAFSLLSSPTFTLEVLRWWYQLHILISLKCDWFTTLLVSAVQQSDSVTHTHTHIFFFKIFFSTMVYLRILDIVPWALW